MYIEPGARSGYLPWGGRDRTAMATPIAMQTPKASFIFPVSCNLAPDMFCLSQPESCPSFPNPSSSHFQRGTAGLARAVVVNRGDMRDCGGDRPGHKPRDAGDVRNEPRQRGMRGDVARDGRCNLYQELARGMLQEPRAAYFPLVGGGGPSLRDSLRSSSSFRRCSSISARIRLAS